MAAQLITEWSLKAPAAPTNDIERHEVFSKYARDVAGHSMPWLFPLLDASNARILVAPGVFCYAIDQHPGLWFDIPEMIRNLQMVPWATEDEVQQ